MPHRSQETERLVADSPPGISAIPHDDNLRYFDVIIDGPSDSAFEGGKFKLELFLPEEYPMGAPKVRSVEAVALCIQQDLTIVPWP